MVTPLVSDFHPDYYQSSAIRDIQNGLLCGIISEGIFTSMVTQSGSPVDTPKLVSYGSNKTSDTGVVSYVDGIFTVMKSGALFFKSRLRAGRSGASGVSHLFFWVEASIDGGVVWNKLGNSVNIHLNSSTETQTFFDFAGLYGVAGMKMRTMFARSSTGNDSGDLIAEVPSAALIAAGVLGAPSAQITIYKVPNVIYK